MPLLLSILVFGFAVDDPRAILDRAMSMHKRAVAARAEGEFLRLDEDGAEAGLRRWRAGYSPNGRYWEESYKVPEHLKQPEVFQDSEGFNITSHMEVDGVYWNVGRPSHKPAWFAARHDAPVYDGLMRNPVDFRNIGLTLTLGNEPPTFHGWEDGAFTHVRTASHDVVTSHTDAYTRSWHINRETGLIDQVEVTNDLGYARIDNRFDPRGFLTSSVSSFNGRPFLDVRVTQYESTDAMTPDWLITPGDIGIETGTEVDWYIGDQLHPQQDWWYDDVTGELVNIDLMQGMLITGERTFGPSFGEVAEKWEQARIDFEETHPYRTPMWGLFVARYVRQHRFDDEQTQKAWAIHATAVQQAQVVVEASRKVPPGERRRPFIERVERIFHDRLVAGLDRLRTRKQRSASEKVRLEQPVAETP